MNTSRTQRLALLWIFAASGVLTACGGGGDKGAATTPPPAVPPTAPPVGGPPAQPPATPTAVCAGTDRFSVYAPATASVGKNVAATVASCVGSGIIGSPKWTQTAGPTVPLLADKTQTISFEPPSATTYSFRVAFVDPDGAARSQDVSINVTGAPDPARMILRASQSVRMGGNVSVRAWPQGAGAPTITWQQIEGPPVTLDTRDPRVALFKAPNVTRDTVVRLRATSSTAGVTSTDEALVLVERYAQAVESDQDAIWGGLHVSRTYAYNPTSPYASDLVPCVYEANQRFGTGYNMCSLQRLPFLAQEVGAGTPTVEQVMNRVVVSNDWVGRNFENFLRTQDSNGDFRRMLKSVTAVVLGVQVRPSFYYAVTGAIYLDGDNFWLTPEERDTVNEAPDFRSNFGAALNYNGLWRYVQDNRSIFQFFDPEQRVTRDVAYLLNESGWLMFHELGHALDFMPPSAYPTLNNSLGVWQNIEPRTATNTRPGQLTSDTVPARYPLTSPQMPGLGQVKFQGATATPAQIAYTPAQVGAFFAADIATDEYAYSSPREDIAMGVEEFLMTSRLGIRRDVAITDKITDSTTAATLFVRWGQRGRVGEAAIKPRIKAAVQQLTPWADPTGVTVDNLAAPLFMRPGDTWSGNLTLPAPLGSNKPTFELMSKAQRYQLKREMERALHNRHIGMPKLPGEAGHRH
jgi:hypothetical protein